MCMKRDFTGFEEPAPYFTSNATFAVFFDDEGSVAVDADASLLI